MSDSKTGRTATQHVEGSAPALPPPPGIDPDWREKIETAKRVREETRLARRGKPATFDMEGPPIRVSSSRVPGYNAHSAAPFSWQASRPGPSVSGPRPRQCWRGLPSCAAHSSRARGSSSSGSPSPEP